MRYLLLTVLFFVATRSLSAGDPHVRDGRYVLTPLASHPDIVTPIGLEFDHKGRLLVIESHTHFAPKNYAGPKADRIRLVEDTDGDGKADRFRTFHEGTVHTMSLLRGPENWIYLATRKRIFRIKDTNNDDVADAEEEIARLDTAGNYPHNGLCGLCFDAAGNLYFGMGENLGEPYKLVGKDVTLTGGGEGGNLYRCRADGAGLEKFSTGVWNPFAICFDPQGRMFTVDNDPDSRPPCRLLQVVRTADYGFQFRFGRQGVHPLQSWNGELPGMLPMLGGTGEAPCDVLPFHGALWVTSWGDNRIERYTLTPAGPVLRAVQDVIIQGDQNFRPVDFAVSPDGTLYFTDWVDKNYTLHGKGRIWKLAAKDPALAAAAWPSLTPAEIQAHSAEKKLDLEMLKNPDATLRQFAISGLAQSAELSTVNFDQLTHPAQRLSLLQAHKWNEKLPDAERDALLGKALADTDADVCLFAVRWIADHDLTALRAKLDGVLKRTPMPASLFQAALAAMDWLDLIKGGGSSKKLRQRGRDQYLVDTLNAQTSPPALRALSLRLLPADNPYLSIERLRSFLKQPDAGLQREAVRALALRKKDDKLAVLAELAAQEDLATALRADAILGLADRAADYKELLTQLAAKGPPAVKAEALRSLRGQPGHTAPAEAKPSPEDTEAWLKLLGDSGDADAGWRVFFSNQGARCAACHTHSGRGHNVGPDLTGAGQRMPKQRLVESILRPSKEIAPMFVPWLIKTIDGKVVTGIPVHALVPAAEEKFIGPDGQTFGVKPGDIQTRRAAATSLMPDGLEQGMSIQDLRDLISFLTRND